MDQHHDDTPLATTRGVGLYYPPVLTTEQIETILKYHKIPLLQPYQTHIPLETDYTEDYYQPAVELILNYLWHTHPNDVRILVYGDYDCDGMTATASLVYMLSMIVPSKQISYYIPKRNDGFGIRKDVVLHITDHQPHLVITVDNGTDFIDPQVQPLIQEGYVVVVTDHHPPRKTPTFTHKYFALCNPKICVPEEHPEYMVSGCYVAAKLGLKLYKKFIQDDPNIRTKIIPILSQFVSLSFISDIIPVHLNNDLVFQLYYGLGCTYTTRHDGIQALLLRAGLGCNRPLQPSTLAFKVTPMINSCGRVDKTYLAMQLLLTVVDDLDVTKQLAKAMSDINKGRQVSLQQLTQQAISDMGEDIGDQHSILYYNPEIPVGLEGNMAGRLKDTYGVPAIALTYNQYTDRYSGSGRSCNGINLRDVLDKLNHLGATGGGHKAAMGMSLPKDVDLRIVRDIFEQHCRELHLDEDLMTTAVITIDIPTAKDVRFELFNDAMEPITEHHPAPRYKLENLYVKDIEIHKCASGYLVIFIVHDSNNNYMKFTLFTSSDDSLDMYTSLYQDKYIDVILTCHRAYSNSYAPYNKGEMSWKLKEIIDVRDS